MLLGVLVLVTLTSSLVQQIPTAMQDVRSSICPYRPEAAYRWYALC